jgi:hypothetical protein
VKKQLHSKRISQCCLARVDTLHPIQTQNLSTQSPDIVSSTCVSWLMPLQFTDCSRLRLGRYDWMAKKNFFNGYFLWTTIGYGVGLFTTYVVLNLTDGNGQPALLYIVPFTLGTVVLLGWWRKELKDLWNNEDTSEKLETLTQSNEVQKS